jgi:hypothetical protein
MKKENEIVETEVVSESDLQDMIPQMNVSLPLDQSQEIKCLIGDDQLLGIYDEIMHNFRRDRKEVSRLAKEFADMVVNGGDGSSSSKEALVNLLKLKNDTSDKMVKIADLMTRLKMKSPDTYKPYLTAKQENKTTINITGRRNLLKKIEQATKEDENE